MESDKIARFQSLLEDIKTRQYLKECLRFGTIRLGLDILIFPFRQIQLLRQVQSPDVICGKDTLSFESIRSFDIEEWNQEQNIKMEKDRRIIRDLYTQSESIDTSMLSTNHEGYPIVQINSLSKWPVIMPRNASFLNDISLLIQRNGLLSLWNGLVPRWIHQCCTEICHYYLSPLKSLFFDILFGVPLEVLECKMAVQSVYSVEKIQIIRETIRWEGFRGFYPNIGLALLQKSIIPILSIWAQPFMYTDEDIVLLEHGYFGWLWNCLIRGALQIGSLIITLPLQNIRRRMILSNTKAYPIESRLITRIPIERYSHAWECCQSGNLYKGIDLELFGILNNVILDILANIETELPNYTLDL